MQQPKEYIALLFDRWFNGTITEEEWAELKAAAAGKDFINDIPQLLQEQWERLQAEDSFPIQRRKELGKTITDAYPAEIKDSTEENVRFFKTQWFRWAAIFLLILGAGTYIFFLTTQSKTEMVQTTPSPVFTDVQPGFDKAILTLSTGQKIQLDSTVGKVITEGNLQIRNNNDGLVYSSSDVVLSNTMATPKGGQYKLILADGTKVWLNAASSITYPTAFTGSTREVSVTGELYFEVAKNAKLPFIVKAPRDQIIVLGTSFNVNTYPDESASKTTLVEGSVKINGKLMKPGEAYSNDRISKTNVDQDIAWKNGVFNFKDMDLEASLRQLSRWYNVDIRFQGAIPSKNLRGEMGRDLTLVQVLEAFKGIGIHTKIENNTLVILPDTVE